MSEAVAERSAEGLDAMVPRPTQVSIGDRVIAVPEMTIEQGIDFLSEAGELLTDGWGDPTAMMRANRRVFVRALAIATDVDPAWLGKQSAGPVLRMARIFVEANEDFFEEALGPSLQVLVRLATRAMSRLGPTASKG